MHWNAKISLTATGQTVTLRGVIGFALLGVLEHLLFFIRNEWHMQAPTILLSYSGAVWIFFVWQLYLVPDSGAVGALCLTFVCLASHLSGLFGSIVLYRVFFHRLRRFPGPVGARISSLWHVYHTLDARNHLLLDRLHTQYGKFVRTGPSEITVFDPSIYQAVDGIGNECTKGPWYDLMLPNYSLFTVRDKDTHDKRRRVWDHAFNIKALREYEDRIGTYVSQLEELVAVRSSLRQPCDARALCYWFSFDVMGEFALAESFGMLKTASWADSILTLQRAMTLLGPMSAVIWLAQIGFKFLYKVWLVRDWFKMLAFCHDKIEQRLLRKTTVPDASAWFVDHALANGLTDLDRKWLHGDAVLLMVAGSDTTAPAMVFLLYRLALHPEHADQIFSELDGLDIRDMRDLSNVVHLQAVINETLRLHPPIPSLVGRVTPPKGLTVNGTFIPGRISVVSPRYTISRLESCFEDPLSFVPERWSTRPTMVRDKSAFVPFGIGRYSCVGKNIARAELSMVAAALIRKYRIKFAPGETGKCVEGDMVDHLTAGPGRLNLMFEPRN